MPSVKVPRNYHVPFLFKPKVIPDSIEDPIKLLKTAADTKNLRLGKTVHAHLILSSETSKFLDIFHANSLINLYAKCDRITTARHLFECMPKRNVVSWTALMAGYLHKGLALEVLGLFKTMVSVDNLCPNEFVFATVLSSCSGSGRVEEGKQCHGYVLKSGLLSYQYVKNALVHMYSSCSEVEAAMRVLNTVPGQCKAWDNVTYITIFGVCAHLKDLRLGLQVHSQMLKTDIDCDVFLSSAMIDMYGQMW
ncbi:hypothetical protein L3X38_020242 [Prunus dulcis]|uniref:Pentatricopeptide repeat-containing protein n=1 Tax=Prunus dulcis TaxID=3755 RepID=A0AAD4WCK4_PRUDU|nr:hypothetical protein L3X38_020242 [Prunus dulcis]